MSLAIKVLNCNAKCQSCYENRIRENYNESYDAKVIEKTLIKEIEKIPESQRRQNPTIHGGEPLTLKLNHLERFLKIIHGYYKSTGIQTNLLLMTGKHIELFKKYNTHIGISLDGIDKKTNSGRGYDPSPVIRNMNLLKKNDIKMSMIIVLRKYNRDSICQFIEHKLNVFGICDFRTNPGMVYEEKFKKDEELTTDELSKVFVDIADLTFSNPKLNIQPVRDIVDSLIGYQDSTCVFNECDPWFTNAEISIMQDGSLGNCLKSTAALDGIQSLRAEKYSSVRYQMLCQITRNQGGCKDCQWWFICKGGCPGAGVDNDWRNRTRFCEAWKILYNYIYMKIKGLMPNIITVNEYKETRINETICQANLGNNGSAWRKEKRKSVENLIKNIPKCKDRKPGYTDRHGDIPHGDHTDRAALRKSK